VKAKARTTRRIPQYFNRIVDLFSGLLVNRPESMLQGTLTTQGRIEHQFRMYSAINVLFFEMKFSIEAQQQRLDYLAQVIAECEGKLGCALFWFRLLFGGQLADLVMFPDLACSWDNFQSDFNVPILAILSDGSSFYFYQFVSNRLENVHQLSIGEFPDGENTVQLERVPESSKPKTRKYVAQIRNACDALYYMFLKAYQNGLQGLWDQSLAKSRATGGQRESTPAWAEAMDFAELAMSKAAAAWDEYDQGSLGHSRESADEALKLLRQRYPTYLFPICLHLGSGWNVNSQLFFFRFYLASKKLPTNAHRFWPITPKIWRTCDRATHEMGQATHQDLLF
jgi:hypothetical protein